MNNKKNEIKNEWEIACLNIDFEIIKTDFDVKFGENDRSPDIANEINDVEILFLFFVLFKRCFNA